DEGVTFGRRCRQRLDIEVWRSVERRSQLSTRRAGVAVVGRQLHVSSIEVERVAVLEQKERRNDDEDRECATIATNLPQLLEGHRPDAPHDVASRVACSTTSRKTSSSDGGTGRTSLTSTPAELSANRTASTERARVRRT